MRLPSGGFRLHVLIVRVNPPWRFIHPSARASSSLHSGFIAVEIAHVGVSNLKSHSSKKCNKNNKSNKSDKSSKSNKSNKSNKRSKS